MNHSLSQYWWLFLLRGVVALLLGLLALLRPGVALAGLVLYLGAYMLIDGGFSIIAAVKERKYRKGWGWLLAAGLFSLAIGIITFYNPFATAAALTYLVAFWALIIGIAEIVIAIRLRKAIRGEGWFILAGILSIAFSLIFFFNPIAGALTLTVLFGIYALIIGVLLLSLAIRLRKRHKRNMPVT